MAGSLFLMAVLALLPLGKDGMPILGPSLDQPKVPVRDSAGECVPLGQRIGMWFPKEDKDQLDLDDSEPDDPDPWPMDTPAQRVQADMDLFNEFLSSLNGRRRVRQKTTHVQSVPCPKSRPASGSWSIMSSPTQSELSDDTQL